MKKILLLFSLVALTTSAQTLTNVNIGSGPNAGNGDSLRVAFSKINWDLSFLLGLINTNGEVQLGDPVSGSNGAPAVFVVGIDGSGNLTTNAPGGGGGYTGTQITNMISGYGATLFDPLGTSLTAFQSGSNLSYAIGLNGTNYANGVFQSGSNLTYAVGQNETNAIINSTNTVTGSGPNLVRGTSPTLLNTTTVSNLSGVGGSFSGAVSAGTFSAGTFTGGAFSGNGAALTGIPILSQNLAGIFTNVIYIQTNVAVLTVITNGGTLTVFLPTVASNLVSSVTLANNTTGNATTATTASQVVNGISITNMQNYNEVVRSAGNGTAVWMRGVDGSGNDVTNAVPSGGGSSGTPVKDISGATSGTQAFAAGELEFSLTGTSIAGALSGGGRIPINVARTFTNLTFDIECSPGPTNNQVEFVYFRTNGVRDTSYTLTTHGYGSTEFCFTSGTGTYAYTPVATNEVVSIVFSNFVGLANAQAAWNLQYR